jgi:hypothetical protein
MQRKEPRDSRDFQRKRLYAAENRVSEGRLWDSLVAAQQYVDGLLTSPWRQRHFPSVRCVVLFDRRIKYAQAPKGVHGGAIQFPRRAHTQLTLLHELAHLASPASTCWWCSTVWRPAPPRSCHTTSPHAACRCRRTRGHATTGSSRAAGVWRVRTGPRVCTRRPAPVAPEWHRSGGHDDPAGLTRGGSFQRRVMARPCTVKELAQVPPSHEARQHPDVMIRRQVMAPLE